MKATISVLQVCDDEEGDIDGDGDSSDGHSGDEDDAKRTNCDEYPCTIRLTFYLKKKLQLENPSTKLSLIFKIMFFFWCFFNSYLIFSVFMGINEKYYTTTLKL